MNDKDFDTLFHLSNIEEKKIQIKRIVEQPLEIFDEAINLSYNKLIDKLIEIDNNLSNLDNISFGFDEINEFSDDIIKNLTTQMDLISDNYFTNEHLKSLAEMKIIYLFKSFEIKLKSLIHFAYPKVNIKDFYRWNTISDSFKNIDIEIFNLRGCQEVNALKNVNNNIKHKNEISDDIRKITDFKNETEFTYLNLNNFHDRIKPFIDVFFEDLGKVIIKDLFEFDDKKIEKISNEYKLRMEKEILLEFANKLTDGINTQK